MSDPLALRVGGGTPFALACSIVAVLLAGCVPAVSEGTATPRTPIVLRGEAVGGSMRFVGGEGGSWGTTELVIMDETATITSVGEWFGDAPLGMMSLWSNPHGVVITWVGGNCDARTTFTVMRDPAGTGWVIDRTRESATLPSGVLCDLAGVIRRVVLRGERLIPDHVTLAGVP